MTSYQKRNPRVFHAPVQKFAASRYLPVGVFFILVGNAAWFGLRGTDPKRSQERIKATTQAQTKQQQLAREGSVVIDGPKDGEQPVKVAGIRLDSEESMFAGGMRKNEQGEFVDENGKPCKACTSFSTWNPSGSSATFKAKNPASSSSSSSSSSSTTKTISPPSSNSGALAASVLSAANGVSPFSEHEDCPPDVEIIGRATWTFLHTTAAYLPSETLNPIQQKHMTNVVNSIAGTYPCPHCRSDFAEKIKSSPLTPEILKSRSQLSIWLCERHNEVNLKLGKDEFDCKGCNSRWRDGPGDGRCD